MIIVPIIGNLGKILTCHIEYWSYILWDIEKFMIIIEIFSFLSIILIKYFVFIPMIHFLSLTRSVQLNYNWYLISFWVIKIWCLRFFAKMNFFNLVELDIQKVCRSPFIFFIFIITFLLFNLIFSNLLNYVLSCFFSLKKRVVTSRTI